MDADDISYPERLQKQYDFITLHSDGALFSCWVRVVGQQGEFIKLEKFESEFYYYNLTFICWIYHPTVIFKKEAVKAVGMYSVPYAEDFELFWQLSRKFKIYNLEEALLDYRVTDQSLHQVLRKREYEEAQHIQLLRNFRHYAGEDYTLPQSYIDCLQHNFQPLLKEHNLGRIVECIRELNFLTQRILEKENVNREIRSIERAAFFKKKFIINSFAQTLSLLQTVELLLKLHEHTFLKRYLKDRIKKALNLKTYNKS
jgi:hypothetical protein